MNEELLVEILKQTRKKYNHFNEIHRMTKELGDALSRNDRGSAQILLGMRGDEMLLVDGCRKSVRLLVENAGDPDRELLESLLFGDKNANWKAANAEGLSVREEQFLNQIVEMNIKTAAIRRETVAMDQVLSRKLAGNDSFYNQ